MRVRGRVPWFYRGSNSPGRDHGGVQEWLGHRDFATTLVYADYQPSAREADLVDDAFRRAEIVARAVVVADAVA